MSIPTLYSDTARMIYKVLGDKSTEAIDRQVDALIKLIEGDPEAAKAIQAESIESMRKVRDMLDLMGQPGGYQGVVAEIQRLRRRRVKG